MMKRLLFISVILTLCLSAQAQQGQRNAKNHKPMNVLVYMIQDMGWQDFSVPLWKEATRRNSYYNTPNIESMAVTGVKFTRAYTTDTDFENASKTLFVNNVYSWSKEMRKFASVSEAKSDPKIKSDALVKFDQMYPIYETKGQPASLMLEELAKRIDNSITDNKQFCYTVVRCSMPETESRKLPFYEIYKEYGIADKHACHAAYMQKADEILGDMLELLEQKGVSDNTAIIIMSINSRVADFEYKLLNYPLRQGAGSVYEGGIRLPLIIKLPAIEHGTTCRIPVNTLDIMPTVSELMGEKRAKNNKNGTSLLPLLYESSKSAPRFGRSLYWHNSSSDESVKQGEGFGTLSAIIEGNWKLIYYYESGKTELFNLKDDIFEIVDQSANVNVDYIRRRLAKDLTRVIRNEDAQIETKTPGKIYKYPNGDLLGKKDLRLTK